MVGAEERDLSEVDENVWGLYYSKPPVRSVKKNSIKGGTPERPNEI